MLQSQSGTTDTNPFRYCGEYFDSETGTYYLRARYYDPTVGRFTQQDTHWNVSNMIYGDNPQKISEREDALGLKTYTCAPQISAIMQSGNLYVYCVSDPVNGVDPTGRQYELERCNFAAFSELTVGLGALNGIDGYATGAVVFAGGATLLNRLFKLLGVTDSEPDSFANDAAEEVSHSAHNSAAVASSSPIMPDPDDDKRSWNKVKERYIEQKLSEQGTNPHDLKREYLGKNASIKRYDIYVDKNSGQLAIFEKMSGKLVTITSYFIK